MTLKDYYTRIKKTNNKSTISLIMAGILISLVFLGIFAIYVYCIYFGWHNLISKIFNLPDLTYFQTCLILIWLFIIQSLFWRPK